MALVYRSMTCLAALAVASAANAQSNATVAGGQPVSAKAPASTDAPSDGIVDIVVTAQRRSERLQNVPVAVTAVTADKLASSGVANTQDLAIVTPGLSAPQTQGYSQPHIRGVGASTNGPGLEQPVATYIDGVYIAAAPSALLSLNNIDRIEVLKGPQGTLFGRNATGGLIQVITRDPATRPTADFSVGYGNFRDVLAEAYVASPISSTVRADLALRYETQQDGWGRNLANGDPVGALPHDFAGRFKILFEPSDRTQIKLAGDYEDRKSLRELGKLVYSYPTKLPYYDGLYGPFPQGGKYDINRDVTGGVTMHAGGVSLQIKQDLGDVTLQSISAYRDTVSTLLIDIDGTPRALTTLSGEARDRQYSQEFQLSSNGASRLKWTAGVFYFHAIDEWQPLDVNVVSRGLVLRSVDRQLTDAVAGYAQATYEFIRDTHITLGGRFNYERKALSGQSSTLLAATGAAIAPDVAIPDPALGFPRTTSFNRFNYRISLDHKFTPDILAYISYNTGFKSGGYNLNVPSNAPYKPEDIDAIEGGLKTEFFNHHLRINAAGYYYTYKNIQIGRYINNNESIYNGAGAHVYGADVDAEVVLGGGLSLTGGFAYNHSRFTSFPNADFIVPCGGQATVPANGVLACAADGKILPYAPEFTFNVGADVKRNVSFGTLTANVTYFRTSRFYAAADNVVSQDPYGLVNLTIGWTDLSGHVSAKVWGKNLGNVYYAQTYTETNNSIGRYNGAPRTYGVTLGYKF